MGVFLIGASSSVKLSLQRERSHSHGFELSLQRERSHFHGFELSSGFEIVHIKLGFCFVLVVSSICCWGRVLKEVKYLY